jgi:hypothetical protein
MRLTIKREKAGKSAGRAFFTRLVAAGLACFGLYSNLRLEPKYWSVYHQDAPSTALEIKATRYRYATTPSNHSDSMSTNEAVPSPLALGAESQLTTGNAMNPSIKETELDDTSTSIIITSSLIPTHPSTNMIDLVVESCFKYLKGISPTVPIYIGVDMMPDKNKTPEKLNQLAQYIANLETRYANQSNIIIVPQDVHRHLAGMVNNTLSLIKTKYVYVLQHDFPFARDVDHRNLVKSMEEYPEYLRCVRFNYKLWNRERQCLDLNQNGTTPADHVNGLDFYSSNTWSDK